MSKMRALGVLAIAGGVVAMIGAGGLVGFALVVAGLAAWGA